MTKPFRPMLAADISEDLEKLRFPVYVTPKLDGVRALVFPDGVYSRSMKKIPNKHVQHLFGRPEFVGLDGELIVGSPTASDVYRVTQSAVARVDGEPDVTFYVFDQYDAQGEYEYRQRRLHERVDVAANIFWSHMPNPIEKVVAHLCPDAEQLAVVEEMFLEQGYEGCILRSPDGLYKNGRSTIKEQGMLKLKRFADGEAEIIGIEEEMANTNAAKESELGLTTRSSHKAGLVGKGRMGALVVRDVVTGVEFKIGTGFTAEDRVRFWNAFSDGPGDFDPSNPPVVKYKHFAIGAKDRPRFPTYVGLREGWDL